MDGEMSAKDKRIAELEARVARWREGFRRFVWNGGNGGWAETRYVILDTIECLKQRRSEGILSEVADGAIIALQALLDNGDVEGED